MNNFLQYLSVTCINVKAEINALDNERLSYLLALVLLFFAVLASKFLKVGLREYVLLPSVVMLAIGFVCYLSKVYERMNSKIIGRWLIAIIVILVGKFNFAIADQSINLIFKIPSAAFTYTKVFISILTLPFSLSLILVFSFPIIVFVSMIDSSLSVGADTLKNILTFNFKSIGEKIKPGLLFCRMLAVMAMMSCSILFLMNTSKYIDGLEDDIKSFAFNFELQSYSYCNLPSDSKSIMISDHLVFFAKKATKSYEFKLVRCVEQSMTADE